MRILQLHTRYRQPGGEDAVVRAEHLALSEAGHDVCQHMEQNPTSPGRAAVALAGSVWNPRAASRAGSVADAVAPDVVHVHNTWFASSPSVLRPMRDRGVPVVMTIHNYRLACVNSLLLREGQPCEVCVGASAWPAIQHRCYRGSRAQSAVAAAGIGLHRRRSTWARHVDRFIVLSEFARDRLVRHGLPADRMVLGSNFVADPGPRPSRPSAGDQVVFVGRLSEEKGAHVLLDAWRRAAPQNLRLTVIGEGPARAELEQVAPDGVEFLGRLDSGEVLDRLFGARALVIPSIWYEGQPLTALEGLSAGTPVVLSRIGGLPEILGGRNAGWLCPPDDPGELARIIGELTSDHEVDSRGAAARALYLERFTPEAAVDRLETVYRSVLKGSA